MSMRGVTMLEILITLSIIVIVATMLINVFSDFRAAGELDEAQANVVGILKDARSRTLSSKNDMVYGVHFTETQVVLFLGSSYGAGVSTNEPYSIPRTVRISSIALTGGASDTVFTRLQGTTTASGTITLQSKRDTAKTKTVTILSTGNVQ